MKKKFLALVLTLAMVLSLVPVTALATGTTQPNIQNPNPVESQDGYVKLEKTAAAVGESDNTFEITLKATVRNGKQEGPKTSTDAVLVIDRSGSMKSEENGDRITPAQDAAKDFASVVLGEGANTQNRIAVVSYEESATTNTELSSDLKTVKDAINFDAEGGTNIQAGIKAARDILKNSTANNKVILVLSDGEPTYSFLTVGTATQTGCWPGQGILVDHYSGTINPDSVRITGFEYSKVVGTGGNYELEDGTTLSVTCEHGTYPENYTYYKDNGQPTIQEASYAKDEKCEIYSIYLGKPTDTNAVSTMTEIATDNDHYKLATDASKLGELFKGIAEDITLPVTPGIVTDPMGDHMNLVADSLKNNSAVTTNDGGFTWDLTKVTPTDNADGSRTYELKYQIIFDTDFDGFDATEFYPTNQETTLSYTVNGKQETANFPIPEVKGKAVTYRLTYDANGGNEGSVPTDSTAYTKNARANLNYDNDKKPTHDNENGKNVIFIGWSERNDTGKIYDKGDAIPNLIQSVTMNDNKTVYAVWGLDKDGDNTPDVFQATVTYKIEHGHWYNAETGESVSNDPVTAQFTLYEKSGNQWVAQNPTLGNTIPTGRGGDQGYTADGWYKDSEKTDISKTTPVTGDVTYTFKYAPTTPKTYTVVLHLEGGSYATTPTTYTENSDGTYQYNVTKTDAVINPESPSRNNFGFTGWSLSKNAPQTLIGEDANFASLYLEQSGTSGSFDKIDLYAVWKEAEAPAPQWDTSKSKKATNLDSNYESKVTLSLPSAEEKLDSDIVFVLDKSTSVQLKNQALEMLNALKGQADKTGAKIKVGVVIFNKIANVTEWKDLETQYDDIKAAIEQDIQEGTNIHAGLLAAKKMLDEDTDVAANRKYMILVSDGVTYQFCHNSDYEKAWTRSFNGELHADKVNQRGTLTELNIQYDNAETGIPQNSISAWMTDIQNRMNNGKDCEETYDYEYTGNAPTDTSQLLPAKEYVSNVEKALYLTKNTYEELSTSYNCYAILARETRPWGTDFMNLLAGGSTLNFESVQNNILYLVAAGSKVEDYMGYTSDYNFNFINDASKLTITVGRGDAQKKLDAVKIDDNHYGFGPVTVETDSSDKVTTYRYNLEYIPGNMTDTEHFVWRINVPVENLAPVALTYSVKLVNPKSASGTYGQYDVDGSKNYSGLYTNNSATLYPKDSNNNWGIPENFLKPTVSYTVSGGSGGNHKPTVTIPDDVPTGLNGKDHYAYVVGYPDGMVYPQKNITRAEVATIFFRLLTDETREANMTKSNSYNDMKDGAWYTCAVSTLSKMGIIKGYEDGSFKPDASISRAEFAAIAARFDPDGDKTPATFSDVSSHWAKDEISIAANHGWIKGYEDGSFKPDQKITRAETMTLVNRVLKRLPETKDDLHKDMKTWPDNQNESAWFYLAVQEATNSHYQKLKKDGTHETWESMRETRDWAALEK